MASFQKIAHRGASGAYPENTRVAFEQAVGAGADMIELDCQLTKDGHVVIFHDEMLKRTAGARGALSDQTLDQLKKLDIGQWRGKAFKGERFLTLEEALETVGGAVDDDPFEAASNLGAASIHVQKELVSREFLRRAWDRGLDVHVWTVNEVRAMTAFAALGVQGLISDFPEKFSKLTMR